MDNKIIGVIGGSNIDSKTYDNAVLVGKLIAESGATLICGGLGGAMEAACKGAKEAGGKTIGILPTLSVDVAILYVDIPIAPGLGNGRNLIIINTAHVLIAISGKYGTLSEIGFALQSGKPVVGLGTWEIDGVISAESPQDAVKKALEYFN